MVCWILTYAGGGMREEKGTRINGIVWQRTISNKHSSAQGHWFKFFSSPSRSLFFLVANWKPLRLTGRIGTVFRRRWRPTALRQNRPTKSHCVNGVNRWRPDACPLSLSLSLFLSMHSSLNKHLCPHACVTDACAYVSRPLLRCTYIRPLFVQWSRWNKTWPLARLSKRMCAKEPCLCFSSASLPPALSLLFSRSLARLFFAGSASFVLLRDILIDRDDNYC